MKSGTSCFKTLFLSAVKRSWPVWTAYLAAWVVVLCGGIASGLTRNWEVLSYGQTDSVTVQFVMNAAAETGPFISFFAAIAAAMCVFSFMYSARSAGAMAVLPINRGKLYFAQSLAGLVPLLAANIVVFAASLCVEASYGAVNVMPLLVWLALVSMQLVLFFGIAAFSAQLTGHIIVLPAAYVVFNFLAAVLEYAVGRAFCVFIYGANTGKYVLTALSPLVYMTCNMLVNVPELVNADGTWTMQYSQADFSGWTGMLVYLAVGAVLVVLGMLLYKHRRMEAAGDVVSVRILKPVFKYCFALGGALVLGVCAHNMLKDSYYSDGGAWELLALMLIGGFVCYFAAEMMINKTFHVWKGKVLAGFAVFAVVLSALVCAGEFDLTGYERRLPTSDEVVSVTVNGVSEEIKLAEKYNVERTIALHSQIVSHKKLSEAGFRSGEYINSVAGVVTLEVEYELKDGGTLKRVYNFCTPAEDIETYEQLLNCQEAIYYRKRTQVPVTPETLSYAYVSYRDPAAAGDPDYNYYMENLNLTPEEAYELYSECILPDIDDGTLGRVWLIMDDDYYNTVYDCSISFELRQPGNEGTRYDYFYTVPTVDSTRTNAWLTEHGVSLEFYDYYEQKDPSIETVSRVSATDIVID